MSENWPIKLNVTLLSGEKTTIEVPPDYAYAVLTRGRIKHFYSRRNSCTYALCIANTGETLFLERTPGESLEPLNEPFLAAQNGKFDILVVVGRQTNGMLRWANGPDGMYALPEGSLAPPDEEDEFEEGPYGFDEEDEFEEGPYGLEDRKSTRLNSSHRL